MKKIYLFCLVSFLYLPFQSFGILRTWIGAPGGNWNNTANWSGGAIPTLNDTALFNNGNTFSVVVDAGTNMLGGLQVKNNTNVTLTATATRTLAIGNNGSAAMVFFIESGSTLAIGGGSAVNLQTYGASVTNTAFIYGTLIFNDGASRWDMISFPSSFTTVNVYGTIQVNATNTGSIISAGTTTYLKFYSGSLYDVRRNGGNVPTADFQNGSVINIAGVTTSPTTFSGSAIYNGLIKWDCGAQTASGSGCLLLPSTSATIDSLRIINTNTGSVRLATNPNGYTIGHLEVLGGKLELSAPAANNSTGTILTQFKISGGTVYGNATYAFDNLSAYPMTLTVNGDFTMTGGSFDYTNRPSSLLPGGAYIMNVKGHVSQTGGNVTATTGFGSQNQLNLNGTISQNLLMRSLTGQISLVITNNSGVSLLENIVLPYFLNLQAGYVKLNNNHMQANGAQIVQASVTPTPKVVTNGFGKLNVINIAGGASQVFPIAPFELNSYNPLTIQNSNSGAKNIRARVEYGNNPPGIFNLTKTINRTWIISSDSTYNPSSFGISYQYADSEKNSLCVPTAPMEEGHFYTGAWNVDPAGVTQTPTGSDPYVAGPFSPVLLDSAFVIGNKFSIVTIGSNIRLNARKTTAGNLLNWSVDNPDLLRGFEVLKSTDGKNFSSIAVIASLRSFNYQYTDTDPGSGTSYYRIRLNESVGGMKYSAIVSILGDKVGLSLGSPLPVIVSNAMNIPVSSSLTGLIQLVVTDISGRTVLHKTISSVPGCNIEQIDCNHLPPGIYQVVANSGFLHSNVIRVIKK